MSVLYPARRSVWKGRLSASFEIENRSDETWRRLEGFAIGHQILDADTELLVVDGERIPLGSDLRPGERVRVAVSIEIPQEPGRYWIYISPMREGVCWYYEAGWRFFVVEAVVENEQVRLERVRQTNIRVVNWRGSCGRACEPACCPGAPSGKTRRLIRSMVVRDISGRYSAPLGPVLDRAEPAMLMLTYFFVFGIVLQARLGATRAAAVSCCISLLGCSLVAVLRSCSTRTGGDSGTSQLRQETGIPRGDPAGEPGGCRTGDRSAGPRVVPGVRVHLSGSISPTLVWLPALAIPQILFTMGVCWFARR